MTNGGHFQSTERTPKNISDGYKGMPYDLIYQTIKNSKDN